MRWKMMQRLRISCFLLVSRAGFYAHSPFCRERCAQYESSSFTPRRQAILRGKLYDFQDVTYYTEYREFSRYITDRSIKQRSNCSFFETVRNPEYTYVPKRYAGTVRQQIKDMQMNGLDEPEENSIPLTVTESSNSAFKRQLGGIEAMHEFYTSRGSEVSSIIAGVQSVYEISEEAVRWALKCLMIRHPLLRSSISYEKQSLIHDDVQMFFVENDSMKPDFEVLDRSDWFNVVLEESNTTFENPKLPLWRARMLNAAAVSDGYFCPSSDDSTSTDRHSESAYMHDVVFIITANHTIIDGAYFIWILQEFMTFLDAYLMRTPIRAIKNLPMLLSIEKCIRQQPTIQTDACDFHLDDPLCQPRLCFNASDTFILDAYNAQFSEEINRLSKQPPQNGSLYLKLSQKATSSFIGACKRENVKTTGALTTACVLAMVDLIFPEIVQLPDFDIPIEHEIDLRRIYSIDGVDETTVPFFTGVAAMHVDVCIRLTRVNRPVDKATFWNIARSVAKFSSKVLGKPNETIFSKVKNSKDVFKISELRKKTEKSVYVLSISNMGSLDHILPKRLRERMKITSLVPHVNILTEDMPIFFIGTQTSNGQLTVLISYCKSYTSITTAQYYMEKLNKYIGQYTQSL